MKQRLYRLGEAFVALSLAGACGYGFGKLQINNLELAEAWFDARLRPYVWPYELALAQRPTRATRVVTTCGIKRSTLLTPTDAMLRQARIVPWVGDGKPRGFKLYAIAPGSIFAQLGLQNGDRVERINGFDLSSPDRALELYTTLSHASTIVMQLERQGTPTVLTCALY